MKALDMEPDELSEDDDMGISVAGDTTINISGATDGQQEAKATGTQQHFDASALVRSAVGDMAKRGLVLGAASIMPALGVAAAWWMSSEQKEATPPPQPAVVSPLDSEYEVLFYDQDGNRIEVPHISKKPATND